MPYRAEGELIAEAVNDYCRTIRIFRLVNNAVLYMIDAGSCMSRDVPEHAFKPHFRNEGARTVSGTRGLSAQS